MNLILILSFFTYSSWAQVSKDPVSSYHGFVDAGRLELSRADLIIGEHMVTIMKMVDKGYVNHEVINKVMPQAERSAHFKIFVPWLKAITEISRVSGVHGFITACQKYAKAGEKLSLERRLERIAGNYCRERALEAISRDIGKTKVLNDEAVGFIQDNLKFFLTKRNKRNFAFFIQSHSDQPEILRRLSQQVTSYSVLHGVVPSQEILKDMLLNEQITKLIQDKGFNPLQHRNVFYAEYGKLIETGYRSLDAKPPEGKVREHFSFLKNYLELNQDHLPVGLCLTRLNDFAKAVFRGGHKGLSREIFDYIVRKNNKEILEDAQFFYLWTHLYQNEFKEALALAQKFNLLKKGAQMQDPRLKFWIGFSHEATGKKAEAIAAYEDIVSSNPLSYYSIMSVKKLHALKPSSTAVTFYPSNAIKVTVPIGFKHEDLSGDHLSSLVRLKAWSRIDSQKMMQLELRRLNRHSVPAFLAGKPADRVPALKSDMHLVHAMLIQESKNYLATFRYLYQVLDKKEVVFNRALLEILYPHPFLQDLTRVLKNDNLDPLIVLSLIRQESVFNPLARSRVGARGLMQIMPATARRLKKSVRDVHLVNPAINIELGTKYFKNLLKRYDGNLVYVLAAYNAGETRVERWKNLYFDTDDTILKNIEAIPFLETRNYVKLIFRNIFFYKLLLEKKELADNQEANKIFDVELGFKR